jgi:hypothetical protein
MIKRLLITTFLCSTACLSAQDFNWQWAKRGGGSRQGFNDHVNGVLQYSEKVKSIAIDQDNNYYFLAQITAGDTSYDGIPITTYNNDETVNGYSDIMLFSTTCDGTYRWSRVIGGGDTDDGYNISLDGNGGVYVSLRLYNNKNQSIYYFTQPRFDDENIMPSIDEVSFYEYHEGYKTIALAKYSQDDGSLVWHKFLQGDVNFDSRQGSVSALHVEEDGTIHALVGLLKGTHLDGLAVVPDEYAYYPETMSYLVKYYIVKLNADGEYQSVIPVPLDAVVTDYYFKFRYDPQLDRYYIGGFVATDYYNPDEGTWTIDFGYNGNDFTEQMFLFALSSNGDELWRKELVVTPLSYVSEDILRDIQIDDESNIYICGRYYRLEGENYPGAAYNWGDFTIPSLSGWGHKIYIMKMDSDGDVLWYQSNNSYLSDAAQTGVPESFSIAIAQDEVLLGGTAFNEVWNGFEMSRPNNHFSDPMIVVLDKETGEVTRLHDILGAFGYRDDSVTALQVDNDGNYVVGGCFRYQLFLEDDDIPTITSANGMDSYSDFFVAKLAATECGVPVAGVENSKTGTIKIFPNPTSGMVTVQATGDLERYTVINLQGQVLLSGSLLNNTIDLNALATGAYIITVSDRDGKTFSEKVIKQ